MLILKKRIFGLIVLYCLMFSGQSVFAQSFGPQRTTISMTTICSSTDRGTKNNGTAVSLFSLDAFQQSYFSMLPGVDLNKQIIGDGSRQKNDYSHATLNQCGTNNPNSGKRNDDEYTRRLGFWSFSAPAYLSFFGSNPNYNQSILLPKDVGNLQSYIKRACGIQSNKLADGKVGIHTLNAARICIPPCEGKCGWDLFNTLAEKNTLFYDKEGTKIVYDGSSFAAGDPSGVLFVDLSKLSSVPGGLETYLNAGNPITAKNSDSSVTMQNERGLGIVQRQEEKKEYCSFGSNYFFTKSEYDTIVQSGVSLNVLGNGFCCVIKNPNNTTIQYYKDIISSIVGGDDQNWTASNVVMDFCDEKTVFSRNICMFTGASGYTGGIAQSGLSIINSLTVDGGKISLIKNPDNTCCLSNATGDLVKIKEILLGHQTSSNNIVSTFTVTNGFIDSLSICRQKENVAPTQQNCPFLIPEGIKPVSKKDRDEYNFAEHSKGKKEDSCSCKKGYAKKNMLFDDENMYSVCQKCDIKKCNCGTKLNTNVPFIGDCILNGDTNRIRDVSYTNGDNSIIVVNSLDAFPVLMGGIIKILMTVVMLLCFGSLIVGGVMMTIPGQYDTGRGLVWKVVIVVVVLGSSGVVLYVINPNFFF